MEKQSGQCITAISPRSPAVKAGLLAGERLLAINGEAVLDLVDYTDLTAYAVLDLELADTAGALRRVRVRKDEAEPLGLCFATSLMSPMRSCRNKCKFCFIDQMPKGVRPSLNVKDDDWRLSFIMGNYVSLTNVDETEFARILRRKAGPLFVSVHATNPMIRAEMMGNPSAGLLLERLVRLKDAGIVFHAQIVLCPGLNDGEVLRQSLRDLFALHPACASVAVVPVGLTKFREGLYPLRPFTAEESHGVIAQVETIARACKSACGSRFVFLSDEWYLAAGESLPAYEDYEDFSQIENGVGLLRLFEEEFCAVLEEISESSTMAKESAESRAAPEENVASQVVGEEVSASCNPQAKVSIAGGTLAAPFFAELFRRENINLHRYAIENRYFGGNVHVAGLITGGDLAEQLAGKPLGEKLLIPANMLREGEDVFLDGMTLSALSQELGVPIQAFSDGEALAELLRANT